MTQTTAEKWGSPLRLPFGCGAFAALFKHGAGQFATFIKYVPGLCVELSLVNKASPLQPYRSHEHLSSHTFAGLTTPDGIDSILFATGFYLVSTNETINLQDGLTRAALSWKAPTKSMSTRSFILHIQMVLWMVWRKF